ncbi:MAG: hypothetical protein EA422_14485 [Gemmatimonadales bacterium]|nr:MAG: hypothetical protein EA422_14485 [Gemmatimonadales bacterium]
MESSGLKLGIFELVGYVFSGAAAWVVIGLPWALGPTLDLSGSILEGTSTWLVLFAGIPLSYGLGLLLSFPALTLHYGGVGERPRFHPEREGPDEVPWKNIRDRLRSRVLGVEPAMDGKGPPQSRRCWAKPELLLGGLDQMAVHLTAQTSPMGADLLRVASVVRFAGALSLALVLSGFSCLLQPALGAGPNPPVGWVFAFALALVLALCFHGIAKHYARSYWGYCAVILLTVLHGDSPRDGLG